MPTYEYKCAACGDVFELKQSFSDEPLTIHEGCGGSVERIIFAPALQFKGSGWYVTDYGRAGSKKDAEAKDSKAKDSTGKDATPKDSSSKNGESASTSSPKSDAPASVSSSPESKK